MTNSLSKLILHKEIILKVFIKKHNGIIQGTDEWVSLRSGYIGGSEMSTITGDNPYQKIYKLIQSKTGLSIFTGNLATRWGQSFEKITVKIMNSLLNTKIYETGSVPGVIETQRYSPDGLSVVGDAIVLFEFKSPFSKIPDGNVPVHYIPQVKTGLCSIPITDYALFVNNMYRLCSLDDNYYNQRFHKSDIKALVDIPEQMIPLAFGIIGFYQTDEQIIRFNNEYFPEDDEESGDSIDIMTMSISNIVERKTKILDHLNEGKFVDIGKGHYYDMDMLLELLENKYITADYLNPILINKHLWGREININETEVNFKSINIDKYSIVIPWKLFKSDIIRVEREKDYMLPYIDKINSVVHVIKKINSLDNINDKREMYNSMKKEGFDIR